MPMTQTRRHFLESLSLAGAAGLLGARQYGTERSCRHVYCLGELG